jgi:signal peptidase I
MNLFPVNKGETLLPPGQGSTAEQPLSDELRSWIKSMAITVLAVFLMHQFVFNFSDVKGQSMEPTLREDDWVLVNKTAAYLGAIHRGDVIVLHNPEKTNEGHQYLVKRVVATGGDRVEITRGKLYVNGQPQPERYTDTPIQDGSYGPVTVPEGDIFVMGDNRHRHSSLDSRYFGPVAKRSVVGRVVRIVWPLGKLGNLNNKL